MERILTQTIKKEDAGKTAGIFLKDSLGLSKAQISSLKFREKGICLNGCKVRVTEKMAEGDVLEICVEEERTDRVSAHLEACEHPIDILYEDTDVICVWKPAGMVVHPAGGHYRDSMANYLKAYFQKQGQQVQMRSIGRLDLDTSGILVFAKNRMAAAKLWEQRNAGIFTKEYLALCEGEFSQEEFEKEHVISLPLEREEDSAYKMCVSVHGKQAVTYYRALYRTPRHTLVRLHLQTGRMHQIRVHMSAIGHPLVGDSLYGNGISGQTFARLCAWKCEFIQPFTGECICIKDSNDSVLQAQICS